MPPPDAAPLGTPVEAAPDQRPPDVAPVDAQPSSTPGREAAPRRLKRRRRTHAATMPDGLLSQEHEAALAAAK